MVNDISSDPVTDADEEALSRIVEYVPNPPIVDTITELEACYRETYEPFFSAMSKEEWRRFTVTSARRTDDGQITPAHDPQIMELVTAEEDTTPDPWKFEKPFPRTSSLSTARNWASFPAIRSSGCMIFSQMLKHSPSIPDTHQR